MDPRAKSVKTMEGSRKNLKIDTASKASDANTSVPREGAPSDATSCISSVDATARGIKGTEVDKETFGGDQGVYYYGYCYPGFSSNFGEWEDQSYYMATDNFEIQPSAAQTDNGSLLYYLSGYEPGCSSYNSIIPGAAVGVEGQYLGQPSYYSSPMLQQPLASPGLSPQSFAYRPELVPVYPWDSSFHFANGLQVHGFYGEPSFPAPKSSFSSRSQTHLSSKTSPPLKFSASETKGSSLAADVKPTPAAPKLVNKGASAVLSRGYIPINKIPVYANQGKGGVLYPNRPINLKESGRNWVGVDKVTARTKLPGLGDFDLNEQNRGPRTNSNENSLDSEVDPVGPPDIGKNDNGGTIIPTVRKDMYNLPDFTTKYDHALFFVIKSYSEDDIHKSIKYNVWASTPNGNRRLDNAFKLAQEMMAEKGSSCPVFLFFSVNASGQFCGVAEMLDRVNFNRSMDFWQQEKWNGYFPVKWHIIKDVPNPQFRHILLENNENKPVTNSRDTQEVKFSQGTEMLNIFKSYISKTSILDDFDFYERRQKVMQHRRSKPFALNFEHPLPKVNELMQFPKPDDLKSASTLQSSVEVGAGKVKVGLVTVGVEG